MLHFSSIHFLDFFSLYLSLTQAPLADPYAVPALEHTEDMDTLMRKVT